MIRAAIIFLCFELVAVAIMLCADHFDIPWLAFFAGMLGIIGFAGLMGIVTR